MRSIPEATLVLLHRFLGIEGVNKVLILSHERFNSGIMKMFGAKIGRGARVHSPLIIHNAERDYCNLTIGDRCHIGKDVLLDLSEPISIGDNVTISMRVSIITHFDVGDSFLKQTNYPPERKGVTILSGAYIGAGAMILHGVIIGENAVVGAGAVVPENIPPDTVAVGIPARVVKKIVPRKDTAICL